MLTSAELDLVTHVRTAILCARKGMSKLSMSERGRTMMSIDGMSTSDVRHLLNNLGDARTRYLEVGVCKGSTIVSTLTGNEWEVERAVGIDLWDAYASVMATGSRGNGNDVMTEATDLKACSEASTSSPSNPAVQADAFGRRPVPCGPFNLYLYDRAHEHVDQAGAFYWADPALADLFVAVVDDWNYEPVQVSLILSKLDQSPQRVVSSSFSASIETQSFQLQIHPNNNRIPSYVDRYRRAFEALGYEVELHAFNSQHKRGRIIYIVDGASLSARWYSNQ